MAIRAKDGTPAIYRGEDYTSPALSRARGDYPTIKSGDRGVLMESHPFSLEFHPEITHQFYPHKWGLMFCMAITDVGNQIEIIDQTEA